MKENYFVGVDAQEIQRLQRQHAAWRPETQSLWRRAGFATRRRVIDLGCGPGFSTLDLARFASAADVVGLDVASAYLEHLRSRAGEAGLSRVSTLQADIVAGKLPGARFDAAFSRWLLAFLRDDLAAALCNVYALLEPGGVLAAMEYLTLGSLSSAPPSAAFDAHTEAWIDFYARNGGDTTVGRRLPAMLVEAGFAIEFIDCIGGLARPGDRWWRWWGDIIRCFGPRFVADGLLDPAQWQALQSDWRTLGDSPQAFIHTPVMLRIIARR